MAPAQESRGGQQVVLQGVAACPESSLGRRAKAALIDGIQGNGVPVQVPGGRGKGIAVIIEAVQCKYRSLRFPGRLPVTQGQTVTVLRYHGIVCKVGR